MFEAHDERHQGPAAHYRRVAKESAAARTADGSENARGPANGDRVLTIHDLSVEIRRGDRVVRPVSDVGLVLDRGETLGIVGETGSGKSMTGLAIMGMLPAGGRVTGGSIDLGGEELFSIPGAPPDLTVAQAGCPFAPRCDAATDRCREEHPAPTADEDGHAHACWHPPTGPAATVRARFAAPPAIPAERGAVPRLRVVDLEREYPAGGAGLFGGRRTVKAVSGVSFEVAAGETFGLVGESGCGKSSLGRMLVALDRPTSGEVIFDGEPVTGLSARALGPRRTRLQMMFQDSNASLDPRMRIGTILREPLAIQGVGRRTQRTARARELLRDVGLPASVMERYPHELSGGQRQRVGLARALALDPKVLVADEPVSALDVSIRSQVLNLMRRVQLERGLSSVVISHDLAVVRYLADRVGVMYLGKLVETGTTEEVYGATAHPYTAGLLAAVPEAHPEARRPQAGARARGELPSSIDPPSGCRFRTRCALATDLCAETEPPLKPVTGTHQVACHYPLQPKRSAEPTTR